MLFCWEKNLKVWFVCFFLALAPSQNLVPKETPATALQGSVARPGKARFGKLLGDVLYVKELLSSMCQKVAKLFQSRLEFSGRSCAVFFEVIFPLTSLLSYTFLVWARELKKDISVSIICLPPRYGWFPLHSLPCSMTQAPIAGSWLTYGNSLGWQALLY